jgi:flagellum-specific peptidoglycan hydrolase FlgJ
VTGGGSYPWPLHRWADVRVQPNPASPDVVSMLADAQAHHRWHPLGDGYRPRPGDWVLFDGHVEVVTRLAGAALYTVGGDSLPDLTVNAHRFPAPFGAVGVLGFVNNGDLGRPADRSADGGSQAGSQADGNAAIPGVLADTPRDAAAGPRDPTYRRHDQQPTDVPGTAAQQAFISLVAPGAIAAQQRYGIPAAVTIAQAIDESGWGRSVLATADHNLFGIKGAGPAGRDMLPTREHESGVWVTRTAPFRVYHNIAESIEDHGRLLATDPAYRPAMASRGRPDAFATALTGVYATDPGYGSSLIALMRLYNLYRYDAATAPAAGPRVAGRQAVVPGIPDTAGSAGRDGIPGVAGALAVSAVRARPVRSGERPGARIAPRGPVPTTRRYVARIPYPVAADFAATAKGPLNRAQPLYQDMADRTGIGWELLAACDWMQCQARSRYSPVHGEKLGTVNPDGTVFRTRSAALAQCASELAELAGAVYQIGLPAGRALSVRELANVFAAFRWGGLLRSHGISAMEFPYSVAGLTAQHLKMRWPDIDEPYAPDRPGTRFRMPFGAVPVVLSLGYRAVA